MLEHLCFHRIVEFKLSDNEIRTPDEMRPYYRRVLQLTDENGETFTLIFMSETPDGLEIKK